MLDLGFCFHPKSHEKLLKGFKQGDDMISFATVGKNSLKQVRVNMKRSGGEKNDDAEDTNLHWVDDGAIY